MALQDCVAVSCARRLADLLRKLGVQLLAGIRDVLVERSTVAVELLAEPRELLVLVALASLTNQLGVRILGRTGLGSPADNIKPLLRSMPVARR